MFGHLRSSRGSLWLIAVTPLVPHAVLCMGGAFGGWFRCSHPGNGRAQTPPKHRLLSVAGNGERWLARGGGGGGGGHSSPPKDGGGLGKGLSWEASPKRQV